MKKSGKEKRAEISLAVFMFLVFCLFISAFDNSQPRDVDKCLALLPFICLPIFFIIFPSFPLRFLSLSFPLYLFFFSFYSMLLYSIILCIYFSMFASHDLFNFLIIAFHCFFLSVPFSFFLLFVSFIVFKPFLRYPCIMYFLIVSVVFERLTYPGFAYIALQCCFFAQQKVFPDGEMLDIVLV